MENGRHSEAEQKVWRFHLQELAVDILRLALIVNSTTDRAVFFDFHGHVSWISLRITESKYAYQSEIFVSRYLDACPEECWDQAVFERNIAKLKEAKNALILCLEGKLQAPSYESEITA